MTAMPVTEKPAAEKTHGPAPLQSAAILMDAALDIEEASTPARKAPQSASKTLIRKAFDKEAYAAKRFGGQSSGTFKKKPAYLGSRDDSRPAAPAYGRPEFRNRREPQAEEFPNPFRSQGYGEYRGNPKPFRERHARAERQGAATTGGFQSGGPSRFSQAPRRVKPFGDRREF
jgi:hypothetical protein